MMARHSRDQLRRFRTLTEAQAVLGWAVILVLAALVGAIYVSQASRTASVGRRIQMMQAEMETLKRENAAMERQIAEAQRLTRLQAEAARLGFVPAGPDDIEYIIVPNYPVVNSSVAMEPTATPLPPPPDTMNGALWLALRSRINGFVQGEANE
ncbi:MAG: hypothetical protein HND44_13380 [Chloroflexi bacterium]|nr:hypothetical protein [Ardenticatenaceae bacterium]MBL1129469.1 hypothetical protein [Chloroflexota bacterium]NOG35549.1 hypothetical protein [Chloroflexota bacterium]GIK55696.1 MAG: hypothetical protein BroJett015_13590 [Chloroflexota bacterium]